MLEEENKPVSFAWIFLPVSCRGSTISFSIVLFQISIPCKAKNERSFLCRTIPPPVIDSI